MPLAMLVKKGEPLALSKLVEDIRSDLQGKNCGAIVTFTGIVRPRTHKGDTVGHLEYEVFEQVARESLGRMVKSLMLIDGVLDVAICHRYGSFFPGEEVVLIAIAAEHSETAFQVLRLAVNRVKHELPIWKKEFTSKGNYWVDLE